MKNQPRSISRPARMTETGGPAVTEPKQNGFGSTLIRQGFAAQLKGKSKLAFPLDGVTCTLEFPLQ